MERHRPQPNTIAILSCTLTGLVSLAAGCERADDASEVVSAAADSTGASEASTTTTDDATSTTVTTASSSASSTDVDSDTVESTSETMRECMGKLYPASAVLEVDSPSREFNGPGELAELSGIRCVMGWVTIRNVSELAPARSLERAFGLALVQNPGLRHVDDLAALRRIRLALVIDENPDLENLDGIASLEALPDIRIGFESFWAASGTPEHGNDALRSLPSFSSLVEPIDSISIGDNEALVDLGSPPTVAIGGLWIMNNESLSFASARAWADQLQRLGSELICGNLNDPMPLCESMPLPP